MATPLALWPHIIVPSASSQSPRWGMVTNLTLCRTKRTRVGGVLPGVSQRKSSCRVIWPLLNSVNSLEHRFGTMPCLLISGSRGEREAMSLPNVRCGGEKGHSAGGRRGHGELGMVQILGYSGNSTDRPHASTVGIRSVVGLIAGSGTLEAVLAQPVEPVRVRLASQELSGEFSHSLQALAPLQRPVMEAECGPDQGS